MFKFFTRTPSVPQTHEVKPIREQVAILREAFPNLNSARSRIAERELLYGADGYFAIPKWRMISPSYAGAVKKVLEMFDEYVDSEIDLSYLGDFLYQTQTKKEIIREIVKRQQYDILVIPALFGMQYRDCSLCQVLNFLPLKEFRLGVFEVACMYLTHSDRLLEKENIFSVICMGDYVVKIDAASGVPKDEYPYLTFSEKEICLKIFPEELDRNIDSGLATGVLQYPP